MPKFLMWNGETTCTPEQKKAIREAWEDIISRDCLRCFPGLRKALKELWEDLRIGCDSKWCKENPGSDGVWMGGKNKIQLCGQLFSDAPMDQARITAVLLHEMVHATGGKELDSEAVEWACFSTARATAPSKGDFEKFIEQTRPAGEKGRLLKSKWVVWNPRKGGIYGRKVDGSIGERCFRSDAFVLSPELLQTLS